MTPGGSTSTQSNVTSAVAGEAERWLQDYYIPLVSYISNRLNQILYTSPLLTGLIWDRLLEFCLAICYAVLAQPPQVEYSAMIASRPFSQVFFFLA